MPLHFSTVRAAWIQLVSWLLLQPARPVSEPTPNLPAPTPNPPVSPPPTPPPLPLERPCLSRLAQLDEADLPPFVRDCEVARKYLRLLGPLDWEHFPERDPHRPWPGPQPQPRAPYVAAFLVKLEEQKRYMSGLREFLLQHPALVWVLGFPLVPSDQFAWGFDVQASLSSARHFGRVLRTLSNDATQFLLDGTVTQLQLALPPDLALGDAISMDTKLILAWVKENNPKTYVKDRYDKTQQPTGDPDCRLGCKGKHNRAPQPTPATEPAPTPTTNPVPARSAEVGEFYWGYASGIVATKIPNWGEFVLAEFTQPFDQSDDSYFFPLLKMTERRLGRRPRFGALDAAFDAFYVYEYFHAAGGFAAVPLAERGGFKGRRFDDTGLPLCKAGLAMPLKSTYQCHTSLIEHPMGRYACPLHFPQPSGQPCPCDDAHWATGGCVTTMATSIGARIRYQLDRDSDAYKLVYKQRTADERINSQAKELGIERPMLRNGRAIANLNSLIYVLINLRALHRVRAQRDAQTPGATVTES